MRRLYRFLGVVWGLLFHWGLPPERGDIKLAQVAIVISFGAATTAANQALAEVAKSLDDLPLIIQREVYWAAGYGLRGYIIGHPNQKYINTFEVLRVASDVCKNQRWSKIALVCHPAHYWRVALIIQRLGLEVVFVPDTTYIPYPVIDPQFWVRNKFWWVLKEVPTRVWFLCKGQLAI